MSLHSVLKTITAAAFFAVATNICKAQVIPDYVADPSVVNFNGTYYLYGTSDIDHGLAQMGPPVVWVSHDMLNWSYNGTLIQGIDFNKPYTFTNSKGAQKIGYFRYWAPGKVFKKNKQYYLFATIVKPNDQLGTYLLIADKPEGPFKFTNGTGVYFNYPDKAGQEARPVAPDIDGDPFVDDDGTAYLVWRRRAAAKLSADWKSLEGDKVSITTKRGGYSEGPFMFKRKGIYYYVYTLSGNANYCYAYMMSTAGPLGPYKAPDGPDIILRSNIATGIWGPGHGNVLQLPGTDDYLFFYLEYGNGGTTRQVFANKLEFNADGTIKPVNVDRLGLVNFKSSLPATVKPVAVTASSSKADMLVKTTIDTVLDKVQGMSSHNNGSDVVAVQRIASAKPENAVDGSNGTYWMAAADDKTPWLQVDMGAVKNIKTCRMYFVESTLGHTWKLERSVDGKAWETVKTQDQPIIKSPQVVDNPGKARYFRVTVLSGAPGLWEFKLY